MSTYKELAKLAVHRATYSANGYRSREGQPLVTHWVPVEGTCGHCDTMGVDCGLKRLRDSRFRDIQDLDTQWRNFVNYGVGQFTNAVIELCRLPD
jgi:hypothetical protein